MVKRELSAEQRKLDVDLWIILIASFVVLAVLTIFNDPMMTVLKSQEIHILLRVALGGALQFGLAGLGITIVSVYRKESFAEHGLCIKNIQWALLLSAVCVLPKFIFSVVTGEGLSYLPFQTILTTKDVLSSGFPSNVLGIAITAICWGFFEGFNYIVISDKINQRYPSKNKWLNWGAITCSVMCILIHGVLGVTPEGIAEMLTVIFLIYGMIMVKEFTHNAWGAVAIFVLFWNAFR